MPTVQKWAPDWRLGTFHLHSIIDQRPSQLEAASSGRSVEKQGRMVQAGNSANGSCLDAIWMIVRVRRSNWTSHVVEGSLEV